MDNTNQLLFLLQSCTKPTFICSPYEIKCRLGSEYEEEVVFVSVREVLYQEDLLSYFNSHKSQNLPVNQQHRELALEIISDFFMLDYKEGQIQSHRNINIIINASGTFEYPTGANNWDLEISRQLNILKEFCLYIVGLERRTMLSYSTSYTRVSEIPNYRDVNKTLLNFMDAGSIFLFIKLLTNKINPDDGYIDWSGDEHELHYFIESLCLNHKIITVKRNKHWRFGSLYFKLKGNIISFQKIKDGEPSRMNLERKGLLDAVVNNLKTK